VLERFKMYIKCTFSTHHTASATAYARMTWVKWLSSVASKGESTKFPVPCGYKDIKFKFSNSQFLSGTSCSGSTGELLFLKNKSKSRVGCFYIPGIPRKTVLFSLLVFYSKPNKTVPSRTRANQFFPGKEDFGGQQHTGDLLNKI
jgi:hypothetical protein